MCVYRYTGLRAFGTNLINHVTLKVRRDMQVENIMLVDSPGMIDSPVHTDSFEDAAAASTRDRGYDFPGVIQWFADRADVILLFFDPDKPVSLPARRATPRRRASPVALPCYSPGHHRRDAGVHDQVSVWHGAQGAHHTQQGAPGAAAVHPSNPAQSVTKRAPSYWRQVDQFSKMHDFARAYGSLCWNLSKVIPRKDLPKCVGRVAHDAPGYVPRCDERRTGS